MPTALPRLLEDACNQETDTALQSPKPQVFGNHIYSKNEERDFKKEIQVLNIIHLKEEGQVQSAFPIEERTC